MRKLVDPVHLFDAKMRPLSSYDVMEKRIKELEALLARALRALKHAKVKQDVEIAQSEHRTLN